MKLIRFDDDRTGLVVELPSGPYVIDVVASVGALVPEDPISHGVLNGLLKDKADWASLIQHWKMARVGLRKLAILAQTAGSSKVVFRRYDEIRGASSGYSDGIDSLDIGECVGIGTDPTGRDVMEKQLTASYAYPTGANALSQSRDNSRAAKRSADRIIVLRPFQHAQLSFSAREPQVTSMTEPASASKCASPGSDAPNRRR
jgi:hypothetical protein